MGKGDLLCDGDFIDKIDLLGEGGLTPVHQHKMDDLNGEVRMPQSSHERNPIEVCFDHSDVDFAYKNAVENSAVLVSEPEEKEWGQKLMYVQDIDGIVVRMGSLIF
ncbi:uncharacterized protein LOC111408370 [Olea europaea var. sylvestris]|uniref:uncharacterized protein LOC111408370 n=1 Tax=Olea europaea var. sylvestris TaxID=158386 RepID=UPI000C1D430A|nr:uncharacterized protein LOC111408370 [Olea europaea var. sylvestris]